MNVSLSSLRIPVSERCDIVWDGLDEARWDAQFEKIQRSSLLQSRRYGEVVARLQGQKLRRGLMYRGGNPAGLVQIQEAGILNNAVHGVILDRGPLWFKGYGSEDDFQAFLAAFVHAFPKRFGRRVRLIPEIASSTAVHDMLVQAGFRRKGPAGYQTIWMNLRNPVPILRKNLKKSWRYDLKRAEKQGVQVNWDDVGDDLPLFLKAYKASRMTKGYQGASPRILEALAGKFLRGKTMLIGHATLDGKPIAGTMIFCHGMSATWQAGWVSRTGRAKGANHLLLWDALKVLKERAINDFDLGGVNDATAHGVKRFKSGMGGDFVEIPGLYV